MVITTVVGLMFFVLSYLGSKQFYMLQTTTEQYVTCESAAKDLQDGSDYLTEQEGKPLIDDCLELKRILIATLKTAKETK